MTCFNRDCRPGKCVAAPGTGCRAAPVLPAPAAIDIAKTIEMAHEAGAVEFIRAQTVKIEHPHSIVFAVDELERFAALVRAQALEEAAQKCSVLAQERETDYVTNYDCADALRGMKSDSGHSTARAGEASTTPAPVPAEWAQHIAMERAAQQEQQEPAACPFCGDPDGEVGQSTVPDGIDGGWKQAVYCNACFAEGPPAKTEDEAVRRWNRRSADTGRHGSDEHESAAGHRVKEQ